MDPHYLFSHGSNGSNITYTPALSVKRSVYESPGALASMPEPTLFLRSIIEGYKDECNRWKYLTVEPVATELSPKCLVIVSEEEKSGHVDWATCRYALRMLDVLDHVKKPNLDMTSSGLCGH